MSARSERSNETLSVPLTRENLAKLRQKARRRGIWFRNLKQNERTLLNLTISVVQRVRSFLLARIVSRLVGRLCEALESRIVRLIRIEGPQLAKRLSEIGETLGCKSAKCWAHDRGLMQFLVVNNYVGFKG